MTGLYVAIGVVVVIALIFVVVRNSIIGTRNRCDEAWSDVDVQLKRRHDLVPNLVESVKGYAQHEQQLFENTTQARAQAMAASGPGEASGAEAHLSAALGELRAVAENYPQLRASENFQQLSSNLAEIEDQIQAARRIFNSNVQAYNTKIQVFPNSLVASAGGFAPKQFFELDSPSERDPVAVSFSS